MTDNVNTDKETQSIHRLARKTEDLGLQVLELQNQITKNEEKIKAHMETRSIESVPASYGSYVYKIPAGRASTVVDMVGLYASLSEEDFFGCISASITKVRKIMSQRDMGEISTTIPGTPGSPVVVYKPSKR